MITKSLKQFVSPIIDNAMATGGRSSTSTTTNYGVIGDALAKKAQMEYNMATFKADMQMRMKDQETANRLAMIDIEDQRMQNHLKRKEESRDNTSFMEKAMGTLQGVASGAQAGFAVGGPKGAIVGGVIGGAAGADSAFGKKSTTGDVTEDRRSRIATTNQTLGSIATIATTARGMYDKHKGNEVYKAGVEDLSRISQEIGGLTGKEKNDKLAEYETKSNAMQAEMARYMGPQEAATAMEGIRKGQNAIFSNDPETRRQAEMAQIGTAMAADPELEEGSPTRFAKLESYRGQMNALNGQKYGFDNRKQIGEQEFSQFAGGVDPQLGDFYSRSVMDMQGKRGNNSSAAQGVYGGGHQIDPATGAPITQHGPAGTAPVATGIAGGTVHIPTHRGAVMDDGGSVNPAAAEQGLAKQGAETVKALDLDTGDNTDNFVMQDREGIEAEPQDMDDRESRIQAKMDEIRESKLNRGLKEERIREIAEHQIKKQEKAEGDLNSASMKEAKKLRQRADSRIESNIKKIKETGLPEGDTATGDKFSNTVIANKAVDGIIEQLESGHYPSGSQLKGMAANVRQKGVNIGGPVGGAIGGAAGAIGGSLIPGAGTAAGFTAGVGAGVYTGNKMGEDFPVGKGSGIGLSKEEENAVDAMAPLEQDFIFSYNKTMDPGVTREFEADEAKKLLPNPALTREENLKNAYRLKERLATKLDTIVDITGAKSTGEMKKIERTEATKQRYEANPEKRYQETFQGEKAKRDFERMFPKIENDPDDLQGQGGFFRLD